MSPELTNLFLDIAGNTPFIGFLLYNWWDSRKEREKSQEKYDQLNQRYIDGLDTVRRESRAEEERLRERYQVVISDLGRDRDQLMALFDAKISDLEKKLESLDKAIRKIFAQLEDLKGVKETVTELKIKEDIKAGHR